MRTCDPAIPFSQVGEGASGGRINDPHGQYGQTTNAPRELAAKVSHLGEIEKRRKRNTGYNKEKGIDTPGRRGTTGNVKRDNRLLFCALALFFFVFLESTLFFQANLAQPGGHGPFPSQFPIQGASTLGLLAFPLKNRLVGEKGRPVFMGAVTVLGVASLVGVVFASSPLVIACTGAVGFFLIGLAGATVYWATCVRSRSIARFATLIGGSHALGVLAQIPLLEFTSNHLVEAVVLSASIIALGVINARIWPPRSALAEFSAQREQRKGKRLESSKFAGWRLDHMTPRTAVIVIFALVLLFSVLFNTLYAFIDIGSPWTSQYTNITPRVLMAVGGFAGGVLFDLHRARYLGIAMFWMMLLSVGAMLGVEAGGPYVVGEVVYFLGSGVFMTFYTTVFIWIAPFLRAPDLWCSMGRALNNVTAIALGVPTLLVINLTSPIAVVVLLIPLIIGINALLFAAGMLDLNPRPRGGETGGRAGKQAGAPPAPPATSRQVKRQQASARLLPAKPHMASPMATCPSNRQQPIMCRKPRKARHPAPRLP